MVGGGRQGRTLLLILYILLTALVLREIPKSHSLIFALLSTLGAVQRMRLS